MHKIKRFSHTSKFRGLKRHHGIFIIFCFNCLSYLSSKNKNWVIWHSFPSHCSYRPQRSEGQEQFGGPRVYHQSHQFQYPDFGQQTNRYEHPRPMREYRPNGGAGNGAPRANGLNSTATFVNSNKSQYNGSNGPSSHPRYNSYASKYETVSDLVRNRNFFSHWFLWITNKKNPSKPAEFQTNESLYDRFYV